MRQKPRHKQKLIFDKVYAREHGKKLENFKGWSAEHNFESENGGDVAGKGGGIFQAKLIDTDGTTTIQPIKQARDWNFKDACLKRARSAIETLGKAIDSGKITKDTIRACELILAYAYGKPDTNSNVNLSTSINPSSLIDEVNRRRAAQGRALIGQSNSIPELPAQAQDETTIDAEIITD